jgi:hypothetical protein
LLDKRLRHRQPEPGAGAVLLGGEERFRGAGQRGLIHACSGVADAKPDVAALAEAARVLRRVARHGLGYRGQDQPAAQGHRIAGVGGEIDQ